MNTENCCDAAATEEIRVERRKAFKDFMDISDAVTVRSDGPGYPDENDDLDRVLDAAARLIKTLI